MTLRSRYSGVAPDLSLVPSPDCFSSPIWQNHTTRRGDRQVVTLAYDASALCDDMDEYEASSTETM